MISTVSGKLSIASVVKVYGSFSFRHQILDQKINTLGASKSNARHTKEKHTLIDFF